MNQELVKKYCDIIIKAGVNLYEGQSLLISAGVKNFEFALLLAEAAYKAGAKFVDLNLGSDYVRKFRIDNNNNPEFLEAMPNFQMARVNEMLANDWATVKIDNTEEIDVMKGIDANKMQTVSRYEQKMMTNLSKATTNFKYAWTIVAVPGPKWAARILNMTDEKEAEKLLWEKMIPIMRLDKPDPVQEWINHSETLVKRSKVLTEMNLDKLVFTAPGTNLEIGLNKTSVWKGGFGTIGNGRNIIPNLPTEEVFTTPDYNKSERKSPYYQNR